MSAPGQESPVEGTPTSTPEASGFDMSPVLDRVNEIAGSIDGFGSRFDAIEQRLPQQQVEQAPDPWADLQAMFQPGDQPTDEFGNPVQQAPQQAQMDPQMLQTALQAAIQQSNAPLVQRLQAFEIQQADQTLGRMIPQLASVPENHPDFQAHKENRAKAFEMVTQALRNYPEGEANRLAADPNYIALHWKAAEADRLAQGQAPAGGQVPSLEAAGGALPGGNGEPVNPVHQAYGAGQQGLAKGFN